MQFTISQFQVVIFLKADRLGEWLVAYWLNSQWLQQRRVSLTTSR